MLSRLYYRFRHLILYRLIGTFSSSLDFALYTFFVHIVGFHYLVANCISILAGITTSFILNRNFNFKVKDNVRIRFVIFVTVGLCGLVLSNIVLYICISVLVMNKLVSKLLSIFLVVFFQFLVNKYVTFKPLNYE